MMKELGRKSYEVHRVHYHQDKARKRKSYEALPAPEHCLGPKQDMSLTDSPTDLERDREEARLGILAT